jgi:ribonuclease P protein component
MQRIKQRKDFLSAAASGHKWVRPAFVLQCAANDTHPEAAALGFTATRKLGNAVMRNRIRRRLKEAARLFLPRVLQPGFDYVVIGRPDAATLPFEVLGKELAEAVEKLHRVMQSKKGNPA